MKKLKINNKGITLVELLIALAIGSIVISAVIILLRQGINSYSKQTISAQLQNDADITLNQMTDAIMEAQCIDIANNITETGNTPDFITKMAVGSDCGNAYSYDSTGKVLYVGKTPVYSNYKNLGILCKNVTSFKVQIVKSSVNIETVTVNVGGVATQQYTVTSVNNPIQVKVSLKLEYNGVSREVSRVAAIRNDLELSKLTKQGLPIKNFEKKDALDAYFTD